MSTARPAWTARRWRTRPCRLQAQHGVDFIIDTLRREPAGTVTLCPLGPLTNIATAFQRAPDIIARVQEIVLMGGGCFEGGNITPAAEFNIYVDPEAADIVFRAGVPLVVIPLDTSHKALTDRVWVEGMRALGTPVGRMVAAWTDFFERFDTAKYGSDGAPLHDPCVIAYLIRPGLFHGRHINVMIETKGEFTLGMTVADWWRVTGREPNALFMGGVDRDGFYALLRWRGCDRSGWVSPTLRGAWRLGDARRGCDRAVGFTHPTGRPARL